MREQWEWAHHPTERDAGSFRREDFGLFEDDPSAAPLTLLDGQCELFDGVTLMPQRGHTPGMSCVLIEAEDDTYIYLADLIPTAGHVKIPYVMGYDLDPVTTCREKRAMLSEASRQGWTLFFEHDPLRATCRVEEDGRGAWRISE
jgi:glyoxylase-like metal-dependent hydrolase (beta-lactamase superfamily II)